MGLDNALGAFLGAAVGDAVGAYLEFWPGPITPEDVDRALTLPGGGCWDVGPGQYTDDTELAVCLAHGLAGHAPSAGFPADSVAREYVWWCMKSRPFDVGNTTRAAFHNLHHDSPDLAALVRAKANKPLSLDSKSNGAIMRATPLAVWAHCLGQADIAAAAVADAELSHPNQACLDANAAYVLAVAHLVGSPGDADGALAAAEGWAAEHACEEVRGWLAAARDDGTMERYDACHLAGFIRHGVQLAFYHLRRRSGFQEGLRHTLLAGGDTDTNAAIVCGMLGALHGASGIPDAMARAVEEFSACPGGSWPERPPRLWGAQLGPLVRRLYQDAVQDAAAGAAGEAAAAGATD